MFLDFSLIGNDVITIVIEHVINVVAVILFYIISNIDIWDPFPKSVVLATSRNDVITEL